MRALLSPEVIQSSAMDCGPACLTAIAGGFGLDLHYGRLREACQTDVDGTSIDVLESVANELGLDAEQVIVPLDHVLEPAARILPAIVVVTLPSGANHFVVIWRRLGPYLQVMDPAKGRCWRRARSLLNELYVHQASFPTDDWRDWVRGDEFTATLRARLGAVGVGRGVADALLQEFGALDEGRGTARLDAAARAVRSLVEARAVAKGEEATRLIRKLGQAAESIPAGSWAMRPAREAARGMAIRGAIALRVRGRRAGGVPAACSAELRAAASTRGSGAFETLRGLLRQQVGRRPGLLATAVAVAAAIVVAQGVLLRACLELGTALGPPEQRWAAVVALLSFFGAALVLDAALTGGLLRIGRDLEARFRIRLREAIPGLADRYFKSRLVSDMADRGHNVHHLAGLPLLAGQILRTGLVLVFTTAGIVWLDPASWPLALPAALLAVAVPLAALPAGQERDMRVRSHAAALSRFYLDAFLGVVCLRVHGAGRSLEREHEGLLAEWCRAGVAQYRWSVAVQAVQMTLGFGLAAWLLAAHLTRSPSGSALLLVYWVLCLPALGENLAELFRQVPRYRSLTLRLVEPLGAVEEAPVADVEPVPAPEESASHGVSVTLRGVEVVACGHTLLREVDLDIAPGAHVVVVGPSGAGKSTLVGLLLGWHRPSRGTVAIDGRILDEGRLGRLRATTAWIDPAVQLWNRSLLDNLTYGQVERRLDAVPRVLREADLDEVVGRLPAGLATRLGESGARISGGEGQRVRLGRAMTRDDARLVVLDEAFRGLDRHRRRELLERVRSHWQRSTLICVTHDVDHTLDFDTVLVVEGGRVVESGAPAALAERADSRYGGWVRESANARRELWERRFNRRLRLENGKLIRTDGPAEPVPDGAVGTLVGSPE